MNFEAIRADMGPLWGDRNLTISDSLLKTAKTHWGEEKFLRLFRSNVELRNHRTRKFWRLRWRRNFPGERVNPLTGKEGLPTWLPRFIPVVEIEVFHSLIGDTRYVSNGIARLLEENSVPEGGTWQECHLEVRNDKLFVVRRLRDHPGVILEEGQISDIELTWFAKKGPARNPALFDFDFCDFRVGVRGDEPLKGEFEIRMEGQCICDDCSYSNDLRGEIDPMNPWCPNGGGGTAFQNYIFREVEE